MKVVVMDRMVGIRERIRKLVRDTGVTQREFARRAHLASETHLGLIIRGKTLGIEFRTLEAIADAGGVSVDYLVTGRRDAASLGVDLENHSSPTFSGAAKAFLELYECAPETVDVVRDFLYATFDSNQPWTAADWFDELRAEHRRRLRGIRLAAER